MINRTMYALKALSSIGRSAIVSNLIHKTPHKTLSSFHRYRQSPLKLIPIDIGHNNSVTTVKCKFHTTRQLCVPPILTILIRPLTRVGAFLFGRLLQRWWSRRTPQEKEKYKNWFTARKRKIYGIVGFFLTSLIAVYASHLDTDPLTGRRRLILLNEEQQNALGKLTYDVQIETHADSLVSENHPTYKRLSNIVNRLLKANEDLPGITRRNWSLTVVDQDEMNVFVLPGGNVFVFLGAVHIAQNDDQLATILAHEIAHVLLLHHIEQVSRDIMLDILLVIPLTLIWAIFPNVPAIILQAFGINITNILLTLPYSRKLENEADDVGLKLAAKACFDVREAVVFWGLMRVMKELGVEPEGIDWLLTHPSHENRERNLKAKLSEAIDLRNARKCPILNAADPIEFFNALTMQQHEARLKASGIV